MRKAKKVKTNLRKEFQIKLRRDVVTSDKACKKTLLSVLQSIEDQGCFDFKVKAKSGKSWKRRGERYDTMPGKTGIFRANRLSLATEKREDKKGKFTKLKCKLHNFVPELLYRTPEQSWAWPAAGDYEKKKKVELRFKLEQDIHFNNCKYCSTGYLTIPGCKHQFKKVKDFLPYFPRLTRVPGVHKDMTLSRVKNWDEVVFEDIEMTIGDWDITGALVTRRDHITGEWDESEFSFKLKLENYDCSKIMEPARGWPYRDMRALQLVYNELFNNEQVFIREPGIFYFADSVSSHSCK
jgi:hypothetical protein